MKTHKVKAKETLSGIAKQYGTTVEALVASNGIKNKDLIRVGQVLQIPAKPNAQDNKVVKALNRCLDKIEALPEFKELSGLLEDY